MEKRSVLIMMNTYNKLALLSAKQDKYLYQLIDEAVILLETKYQNISIEENHE